MAGVATAYSSDALTSGAPENSSQWEFSVPLNDVSIDPVVPSFFFFVAPCRGNWVVHEGVRKGKDLFV